MSVRRRERASARAPRTVREGESRTDAAVLVPTYVRPDARRGEMMVVLVRRTDRGVHGGEIAFPGGKCERGDASPLDTALRESEEELGLDRARVRVVRALAPIDTYTTAFRIHPFLARIDPPPAWTPEPGEIAEVIEVPAAALADPAARGEDVMTSSGRWSGARFPYVAVGAHRLWGATLRILEPLLPELTGLR